MGTKPLGEKYILVLNCKMWRNWYLRFDVDYKIILHYSAPPFSADTKFISPATYFDNIFLVDD